MTVQTELYSLEFKVFTPSYLDELRKSILASEYFGESELSSSFKTTKGFSVIFKKSGIDYKIGEK